MGVFDYIIERVRKAEFTTVPFRHIYIEEFLTAQHFAEITASPEVLIPPQQSDEALFETLCERGYAIIDFPGCITDKAAYISWRRSRRTRLKVHPACEGFGMTLRLTRPKTQILIDLRAFLEGPTFNAAIAEEFGVAFEQTFADGGIQKYLDGYEISPHPDIRHKSLTFMVNINPHPEADRLQHHTHYLRLRREFAFIQRFWEENLDCERCWLPWEWCETVSTQSRNNSMVIFAPGNDTLHAVKASYDHLGGARTQLYGNLWSIDKRNPEQTRVQVDWHNFDIKRRCEEAMAAKKGTTSILQLGKRAIRRLIKKRVNRRGTDGNVIEDRLNRY